MGKNCHICAPWHLSRDGATLKLYPSNHDYQNVAKILGMQRLGGGTIKVKKYFALVARNGKTALCASLREEVRWGSSGFLAFRSVCQNKFFAPHHTPPAMGKLAAFKTPVRELKILSKLRILVP